MKRKPKLVSQAKLCLFASGILFSGTLFAQTNSEWNTTGNTTDTSAFIGTTNSRDVKIKTNDQERVRITEDGKVGIGVKNPHARLDVKGNVKFRSGNIFFLNLKDSSLITDEILLIDSTGTLKRGGDLKSLVYGAGPDPGLPCLTDLNGLPIIPGPIWQNSPGKLFADDDCIPDLMVGIGTTNPLAKLDIHTKGTFGIPDVILVRRPGPPGTLPLLHLTSSGMLNTISINNASTVTSQNLVLNSGGNTPLIIARDHQNNKIFQLENSGLLLAREIKVNLQSWPDYVFQPGYNLLPLEEVETFIRKNGHLPEVPSAETVTTEGLDLGEANRMLLQKVEELTLYLIEQDKRIDVLETELQTLKP